MLDVNFSPMKKTCSKAKIVILIQKSLTDARGFEYQIRKLKQSEPFQEESAHYIEVFEKSRIHHQDDVPNIQKNVKTATVDPWELVWNVK